MEGWSPTNPKRVCRAMHLLLDVFTEFEDLLPGPNPSEAEREAYGAIHLSRRYLRKGVAQMESALQGRELAQMVSDLSAAN